MAQEIDKIPYDRILNLNTELAQIQSDITSLETNVNTALTTKANDDAVVHKADNEQITGLKTFTSTINNINANFLRAKYGNYGLILRNDGGKFYFLMTNSGDQDGNWNDLRPLSIDLATGIVTIKDLTCTNVIQGTALQTQWGDLAENYYSDDEYKPGTLVQFGGEKEITIAKNKVNGIVSSKPGILLNKNEFGLPIALSGKIYVRVIGKIQKGDELTLYKNGIAKRKSFWDKIKGNKTIAIALENNLYDNEKLVYCVTKLEF